MGEVVVANNVQGPIVAKYGWFSHNRDGGSGEQERQYLDDKYT